MKIEHELHFEIEGKAEELGDLAERSALEYFDEAKLPDLTIHLAIHKDGDDGHWRANGTCMWVEGTPSKTVRGSGVW